jgi:hypothetical protein
VYRDACCWSNKVTLTCPSFSVNCRWVMSRVEKFSSTSGGGRSCWFIRMHVLVRQTSFFLLLLYPRASLAKSWWVVCLFLLCFERRTCQ